MVWPGTDMVIAMIVGMAAGMVIRLVLGLVDLLTLFVLPALYCSCRARIASGEQRASR
jgi:hypothetical protein